MTDDEKLPWPCYYDDKILVPQPLFVFDNDQARALYRGAKMILYLEGRRIVEDAICIDSNYLNKAIALLKKGLGLDDEKACEHEWCTHTQLIGFDPVTGASVGYKCADCGMETMGFDSEDFDGETKCTKCGAEK